MELAPTCKWMMSGVCYEEASLLNEKADKLKYLDTREANYKTDINDTKWRWYKCKVWLFLEVGFVKGRGKSALDWIWLNV